MEIKSRHRQHPNSTIIARDNLNRGDKFASTPESSAKAWTGAPAQDLANSTPSVSHWWRACLETAMRRYRRIRIYLQAKLYAVDG
jgi:hypothetical protein